MKSFLSLLLALLSGIVCCSYCHSFDDASESSAPVERAFVFNYAATITELVPGSNARVWFPLAQSNDHQQVTIASVSSPAPLQRSTDALHGNEIGYFEFEVQDAGIFAFQITYEVVRKEAASTGGGIRLTAEERERYLKADSLVPIDGRPVELIAQTKLPSEALAAGRVLYEVVEQHMAYDKSKPGYGNGDSVWACDSKTGNCTDFHSLFISLARSRAIPARFEIGFPLPPDENRGTVGGYHCWAWFFSESAGWSPVDISEADKHPEMKEYYFGHLTADRIAMTTGRDIELVPASAGGPLNYFVYPYVEVDGVALDQEKIKPVFSFENIEL